MEPVCLTGSPSGQTSSRGCPGVREPCLRSTFSPTLSCSPEASCAAQDHGHSWAWVSGPRTHLGCFSRPRALGEGSLRPGSDQLGARLPGARGERCPGFPGLPRRRRSLEGSQQPPQVGGLGWQELSHSAREEGPSAKAVQVRPAWYHPLDSPGQNLVR